LNDATSVKGLPSMFSNCGASRTSPLCVCVCTYACMYVCVYGFFCVCMHVCMFFVYIVCFVVCMHILTDVVTYSCVRPKVYAIYSDFLFFF
jgi:hypothetical protein